MIEIVNATIIGEITFPYAFFIVEDGNAITGVKWFKDDAEAIEWFRLTYPELYGSGVEMRCYNTT